jgi:hypothetical protein
MKLPKLPKIPTAAKVGIGIGVSGLLTFIGYKTYKKIKAKKEIKNFDKASIQVIPGVGAIKKKKTGVRAPQASAAASSTINLKEVAQEIGEALGTAYSKADPRSWNENEEKAAFAVLKVPPQFIPELEKEYLNKYKRSLRNDLQQYLDEYYDRVRHLFV